MDTLESSELETTFLGNKTLKGPQLDTTTGSNDTLGSLQSSAFQSTFDADGFRVPRRVFQCNKCDKYYANFPALRQHYMSHKNFKTHKCPECGKGFRSPSHLAEHKNVHLPEPPMPFECKECGKKFRIKGNYNKHLAKQHAGETPRKRRRVEPPESEVDDVVRLNPDPVITYTKQSYGQISKELGNLRKTPEKWHAMIKTEEIMAHMKEQVQLKLNADKTLEGRLELLEV
ncbi:hypothetical protein L596_021925 [Steinernema carpocapsae]|uniref:C2H2-type domain-containing protein n=1 Tax=Steinernema carpocapsae TaxID=34508 RepID=A0A4U5ML16_STECR|nr:hypothetical protein L596_021925 [Steinernema carpocapsae]